MRQRAPHDGDDLIADAVFEEADQAELHARDALDRGAEARGLIVRVAAVLASAAGDGQDARHVEGAAADAASVELVRHRRE